MNSEILKVFHIDQTLYNMVLSMQYLPLTFLSLLGAVLVQKAGINVMLMISQVLACTGQGITAVAARYGSLETMFVARAVYGVGSELIFMLQAICTSIWFREDKLGVALSLISIVPLSFKVLSGYIFPRVTTNSVDSGSMGIEEASLIGFYFCIVSTFFAVMLVAVDKSLTT